MTAKPNFFIVGAAKAATTSLWIYLKQHPEIYMPEESKYKEPALYCPNYGMTGVEEYMRLFSGVTDEEAVGEASTAYLAAPESAAMIRNACPEARIIIVLRNPVDRAYSLYRWMVNHGYEWLYPFERALEEEKKRMDNPMFFSSNPENYYNYLYFHSGLYSQQVLRYLQEFPEHQVKILLFEDVKNNPRNVVRGLYRFLGVDDSFMPKIAVHNKADFRPVNIRLHFALKRLRIRYRHTRVDRILGAFFFANLRMFGLKWPQLNPEIKRMLINAYRSDIEATSKIIGRDLSAWVG